MIPSCGIQIQKDVFITIQAVCTLLAVSMHFLQLKLLLVNAWIGCLPILSVAIYFFGVLGNSNYQYLPQDGVERVAYFP